MPIPARCHRSARGVVLLATFFAAIAAADASAASTETPSCKESDTPQAALENAKNLVVLEPNEPRPTFNVQLGSATSGRAFIQFNTRERTPGTKAVVAAQFFNPPQFEGHQLGGASFVGAKVHQRGDTIGLYACFENVPQYAAGRYEGTVTIYGPKIADFTYAIIVSTKWPRWIALLTIAVTFIGSMIVGFFGGALTLPQSEERTRAKGYVTLGFAGVFAVALAALSYWSVYASNETWGSDPPSDLTALVSAAFAAAIGGLITAKKLLSGNA